MRVDNYNPYQYQNSMPDVKEKEREKVKEYAKKVSNFEAKASKPDDDTALLTRRLVMAATSMEVIEVRASALTSMAAFRLSASMGELEDRREAQKIIRKLEKLIQRSGRKIKDLNKEESLEIQEDRAVNNQKMELVRQLEEELKRRELERRAREKGYLDEITQDTFRNMAVEKSNNVRLSAADEARIERIARMQAEATLGGDSIGVASEEQIGGEAVTEAGSDIISGEVAESMGTVDISV